MPLLLHCWAINIIRFVPIRQTISCALGSFSLNTTCHDINNIASLRRARKPDIVSSIVARWQRRGWPTSSRAMPGAQTAARWRSAQTVMRFTCTRPQATAERCKDQLYLKNTASWCPASIGAAATSLCPARTTAQPLCGAGRADRGPQSW